MSKLYNTQEDIATSMMNFLSNIDNNIRKTQLNIIPYIAIGMIDAESCVATDIAKKLKGNFSLVQFDSVTKRIRRFFNNKLFDPYYFYENVIKYVINSYKIKHHDNKIHIIFDHMYSKENYTVFMFSMRVGKQGIPLFFRCFDGIRDPNAFTDETIVQCIKTISSYFNNTNFKLIFLADRWFNSEKILNTIDSLGHTYNIRIKGNIKIKVFDKKEGHYIYKYASDLTTRKYKGKYYNDVYLYDNSSLKTNIAVSKSNNIDEPWIIATNGNPNESVRSYSYRFGGIECIFKNQKSNGFYIEKICNANLKAFTSMFSIVCFSVLFLTILGCEYSKNNSCYKKVKIETHKKYNGIKRRVISLFNTGLILFHRAFNSSIYIRIPIKFILYDI